MFRAVDASKKPNINDAIEQHQITQVLESKIYSAYNRTQYWDERVKIMDWYGELVKGWMSKSAEFRP